MYKVTRTEARRKQEVRLSTEKHIERTFVDGEVFQSQLNRSISSQCL